MTNANPDRPAHAPEPPAAAPVPGPSDVEPAGKLNFELLYDAEIAPLVARIIEIAKAHNLPFVATFWLREDGTEAEPEPLLCTSRVAVTTRPTHRTLLDAARVIEKGWDVVPRMFAISRRSAPCSGSNGEVRASRADSRRRD